MENKLTLNSSEIEDLLQCIRLAIIDMQVYNEPGFVKTRNWKVEWNNQTLKIVPLTPAVSKFPMSIPRV